MCCRDLPDPLEILDQAIAIVPAPPITDVDPRVVNGWIERVQAALVSRREAARLARAIEKVRDTEWRTRVEAERTADAIGYGEWVRSQREAGTYWAQREKGRVSQRPVRIQCDPEIWAEVKDRSIRRGVTVGEHVGHLVTTEARRLRRGGKPLEPIADPAARTRYLRIDCTTLDWIELKSAAERAGVGISRYVGLAVDRRPAAHSPP